MKFSVGLLLLIHIIFYPCQGAPGTFIIKNNIREVRGKILCRKNETYWRLSKIRIPKLEDTIKNAEDWITIAKQYIENYKSPPTKKYKPFIPCKSAAKPIDKDYLQSIYDLINKFDNVNKFNSSTTATTESYTITEPTITNGITNQVEESTAVPTTSVPMDRTDVPNSTKSVLETVTNLPDTTPLNYATTNVASESTTSFITTSLPEDSTNFPSTTQSALYEQTDVSYATSLDDTIAGSTETASASNDSTFVPTTTSINLVDDVPSTTASEDVTTNCVEATNSSNESTFFPMTTSLPIASTQYTVTDMLVSTLLENPQYPTKVESIETTTATLTTEAINMPTEILVTNIETDPVISVDTMIWSTTTENNEVTTVPTTTAAVETTTLVANNTEIDVDARLVEQYNAPANKYVEDDLYVELY